MAPPSELKTFFLFPGCCDFYVLAVKGCRKGKLAGSVGVDRCRGGQDEKTQSQLNVACNFIYLFIYLFHFVHLSAFSIFFIWLCFLCCFMLEKYRFHFKWLSFFGFAYSITLYSGHIGCVGRRAQGLIAVTQPWIYIQPECISFKVRGVWVHFTVSEPRARLIFSPKLTHNRRRGGWR